jgi:endonuclease/exonuclease/phosphatase family metal-dependent hydrolase
MRRSVVGLLAALAVVTAVAAPSPALAAGTPSRPTIALSSTAHGTFLTWSASNAGIFEIQQATDARFTREVRTYVDRDGRDRQFTPPEVATGGTYWFRIRGKNGAGFGAYSPVVRATVAARLQAVRVMTYNVFTNAMDGQIVNGERVASWSRRAVGVVDLIRRGNPDFVAIQEGLGWVAEVKGPRQVDDLVTRLGGVYGMAYTELTPGLRGWYRTGRYILYKSAVYAPLGAGGHWDLGRSKFAAYQVFRHKTTGARFLVVSLHLSPDAGPTGESYRQAEMAKIISYAKQKAAGLPIVYAGDTNSHDGSNHPYDGPGNATRAAKVADAFKVAPKRYYVHINSANQHLRRLPMGGRSIDRVFGSPGVALRNWRLLAHLSGDRLVGVIPSDHNPIQVDLKIPY